MLSGLEHHRPRDRRLARHRRAGHDRRRHHRPGRPPRPALAGGIGDAFLVAAIIAAVASIAALCDPARRQRASCPSSRLAPPVAIH